MLTEVVISLTIFVPFYLFLIWCAAAGAVNMALILLVCAVVLVALTAMGVMIGLLALLWRQVSSIAQVLGMLFEFLGGAYLPVSNFPQPLQYLAYLLPYTWGYDLIRYYSFDGHWQNATAGVAGVAHPHRLRRGLHADLASISCVAPSNTPSAAASISS